MDYIAPIGSMIMFGYCVSLMLDYIGYGIIWQFMIGFIINLISQAVILFGLWRYFIFPIVDGVDSAMALMNARLKIVEHEVMQINKVL